MTRVARPAVSLLVALAAGCSACAQKDPPAQGLIYFISERGGHPAAFRIRPDGSGEARVLAGERPSYPYGASADGRAIALVESNGDADEIVIARPDGSSARRLAESKSGFNWYPTFSPDGSRVLFESSRDAFRELYVVNVAGGEPVRLTDNREGNFDAAWSPDGTRIAFASSRFGQLDLFVMNADGSDPRRLTQHAGDSIKPAWAPKTCAKQRAIGGDLAFLSGRDGRDNLFSISSNGGDAENITRSDDEVESFAWRPDGCAIVFAARAKAGNQSKIRVLDLVSGEIEQLSGAKDNDANPAWSPDGSWLAFASSENGKSDLFLMRADGKRRVRLTHDPVSAWLPRWLEVDDGGKQQ